MLLKALKSKIHRATVTDSQLEYPGSIGIDSDLLKAAGISPYEAVFIVNVNNGQRFETYAVPEEAGSGRISILGAAARLAQPKDIIIIMTFGFMEEAQLDNYKPVVVIPDQNNKILEVR